MSILISILIFCIVAGLIWYLISLLPLPAPFGQVVRVVLIVIAVLWLVGMLTGYAPSIYHGA
jgi:hypothetical protein